MPSLNTLIGRLGLRFDDMRLVEGALAHRSYINEHPDRTHGLPNAERLEFLGDAVLNYIAAELVYQRFPEYSEGELTRLRTELIKTPTLAAFARELELGHYVLLSRGEDHSGARDRDSLLADMFESLLAAIYFDQGLEAARAFMLPLLERQLALLAQGRPTRDYKSHLQEYIQAQRNITPLYHIIDATGPDHQREFTVEVRAGDELLGCGRGSSKQAATQDAARAALEALEADEDT